MSDKRVITLDNLKSFAEELSATLSSIKNEINDATETFPKYLNRKPAYPIVKYTLDRYDTENAPEYTPDEMNMPAFLIDHDYVVFDLGNAYYGITIKTLDETTVIDYNSSQVEHCCQINVPQFVELEAGQELYAILKVNISK